MLEISVGKGVQVAFITLKNGMYINGRGKIRQDEIKKK